MRDAYHDELDAITEQLVEMTRLVGTALTSATEALLGADVTIAEAVIDGDAAVNVLRDRVERRTVDLIARQQPVAGDLRMLTTGLRITSDLERSGDMAVHIAKLARRKYPACAVPPELQATIREMGVAAAAMVGKAADVIRTRDLTLAGELESDDDVIDALHKTLLVTMLAPDWPHGVDTAIDLALAGRYYERFADHAVSVARQVVYLVTGETAVRA
ncbi:MAG TPA: phosphate signaling complex protein PhoU [Acidothermaceae bacterium]|jgi:phosphate transport system protein|nr:phosphate signaling complex protein PhoU [Acidothermaceae bacterium]